MKIEPSANLTWTSCFESFDCSRLEVPLDYSNRDLGTTSIAFIKLAGKNATPKSPSMVLIPGKIFHESYNLIELTLQAVRVVLVSTYSSHPRILLDRRLERSTTSSPLIHVV